MPLHPGLDTSMKLWLRVSRNPTSWFQAVCEGLGRVALGTSFVDFWLQSAIQSFASKSGIPDLGGIWDSMFQDGGEFPCSWLRHSALEAPPRKGPMSVASPKSRLGMLRSSAVRLNLHATPPTNTAYLRRLLATRLRSSCL